ncbi:hypothetical protein OC845_005722 [Tilletia horrida]|nr:hypothetical protein OC845_005722 [Tilletia horrida]
MGAADVVLPQMYGLTAPRSQESASSPVGAPAPKMQNARTARATPASVRTTMDSDFPPRTGTRVPAV